MKNIKFGWASALIMGCILASTAATADIFRHTITGEDLKVPETAPEEGRDTEAVKHFLESGVNLYTEVKACLPKGEEVYLTACSGCHGHYAEGKLGPGLNDAYWTYPKNSSDKGLFETIYGGAQGMMGPHNYLTMDEMLKLMAWVRHLYAGDPAEAVWLSEEQQKSFKPFKPEDQEHASAEGSAGSADVDECKVSAN